MKKAKRIIGAVLIFALLALTLSACGKSSKITGEWYNEKGETLNVQQDGSYNYEGEYGTGTWKVLDDKKTIEFRDFYGETTNVELVKDDLGEKIKYHGYDFYKDSYPSNDENKGEQISELNLTRVADFKNGYAWVESSGGSYSLINTKGKAIYTSESCYKYYDMSNDACFVQEKIDEEKYVYKIIDKNGQTVASSADGEFDEILASGDNLFLVHKYEGSIDSSRDLYGTINEKGKFVNKLRECPFMYSQYLSAKYIGAKSFLLGESSFFYNSSIYMSSCDKFFENSNHEYAAEGAGDDLYILDNRGIKAEGSEKEYRYSEFGDDGYKYVVIRSDGKIEKAPEFNRIVNGLLVAEESGKKAVTFNNPKTGKTFAFSKYYISDVKAADDNLLVSIKGDDGKNYYTVLDGNGNMLFEPILGTSATAGDGKITLLKDDDYLVLDYSGNVIIDIGKYSYIGTFNDGIAWAKNSSDQYVGIDEKGNVVIS